jgi:hypothetical protein
MNYEQILNKLIENGMVTEEDVERVKRSGYSNAEYVLADLLHTLLCVLDHDKDECKYYAETQMINTWERPNHLHWLERQRAIREKCNIPHIDPVIEDFAADLMGLMRTLTPAIHLFLLHFSSELPNTLPEPVREEATDITHISP